MNAWSEAVSPLRRVKQTCAIHFTTPAFLGDASQTGYWRTPPFKALLRDWWRIAVARDHGYDHGQIREAEGRLFGNAWLDREFQRSQVVLRLEDWRQGKLMKWAEPEQKIAHPEVKFPVDAHLYLGYGPLNYNKATKKAAFADKVNAAIQAGEMNTLHIAGPHEFADRLEQTLQLIHWFGAVGGRARNGWGSLALVREGGTPEGLAPNHSGLQAITRPWPDCLALEWPHALGRDAKGLLIWRTQEYGQWREVMKELAKIKIAFRTALKFTGPPKSAERRHVLAYPVTNHPVQAWGHQARLANQLRFKVLRTGERLIGLAYHLPCGTPTELLQSLGKAQHSFQAQQLDVWQTVHAELDTLMNRLT